MIKKITYTIGVIIFLWWFFLAHVSFSDFSDKEWIYRENEQYIAKTYTPKLINPFGLYFHLMKEDPTYVVLFDKNGRYLGQSSPFFIDHGLAMDGGQLPENDAMQFYIVSLNDYTDEYIIPVNNKKWWSYILQYFH
ncbi:DUF6201 family protein [Thorsellia kenyensis]|uniref:DUF6201 family protein n=1 Tax=Thorsellia kenyensis TaxID=1549888 RepID=A0ABV6C7U2_9GAMM